MTDPAQGEESLRQARLVDQAASMHAALRDRATHATTSITVVLLSASIFSVAFAFAGNDPEVELLGITASRATWLGVLAILTVCGSTADLVSDRRGAARVHDGAVRLLADLKSAYRSLDPAEAPAAREIRLTSRYQDVMAQLPPIPERRFNQLKARHLRKIEISRILSENPGLALWQARRRLNQRLRS